MATEKSSADDAKTSDASSDSAPNGSKAVAKSKGSEAGVDEIRTRAYEIFQARHGGPGSEIGDWQKADVNFRRCAQGWFFQR